MDYCVRASRCDYRASEVEILKTLSEITAPLERCWNKLKTAETIVVKTNMVMQPERIRYHDGHRQELVDESVFRAVLRMLRDRTQARLIVVDTSYARVSERPGNDVYFLSQLEKQGVGYHEASVPPHATVAVPGGGLMFDRYKLSTVLSEADAVVSLAKMKNHAFMGVTLCLKNLFGLTVTPPHGHPRTYFHHLVRLPYVLADLGRIIQPDLCIVDGLVAQSGREWGGEARTPNVLVAGDHVIATDTCATWLMGHDPQGDWPNAPFRRDRNALRVSAESGFGTASLDEIDFCCDREPPLAAFDSDELDPSQKVTSWRRTMCEQALHYREHQTELAQRYEREYVYLQNGAVIWHGADPRGPGSRRLLSGSDPASAVYLKWADPQEEEGERFEVYESALVQLEQDGRQ